MDVKNVFLNGFISIEIYMKPPPGLPHPSSYVCRLRRALYGLKQASRAWFTQFCEAICSIGYTQSASDFAFFYHKTVYGYVLLLLFVDDMIITGKIIRVFNGWSNFSIPNLTWKIWEFSVTFLVLRLLTLPRVYYSLSRNICMMSSLCCSHRP